MRMNQRKIKSAYANHSLLEAVLSEAATVWVEIVRVRKKGRPRINHSVWKFGQTSTREEAVLHGRNSNASLRAIPGSMSTPEIGEEEADKLKRLAYHAVP